MEKTTETIRKILIIIFVISILFIALSGHYSFQNIDKLAYVIALGIDVGKDNTLELSIQLSKPSSESSSSSSSSSSSGGGASNSTVSSVECSSIESGLNLFNNYISRTINLAHCKVIVISEELASLGISEYIYTLNNNVEVSSHANLIISKCSAKEFLDFSDPVLETLTSRYYEIAPTSSEYTGFIQNVTLIEFFNSYIDSFKEPVAILGSKNDSSSYDGSTSDSAKDTINKDASYTAGKTPISSDQQVEDMGLAVFHNDKLVGELTGLETICHLIFSNDLTNCNISIPNPLGDSKKLDVNLKLCKNTKNSVSIINGTPYISSKVCVNIKIVSTTENADYFTDDNVKLIEETCNKYLKDIMLSYLYKTSILYNADIDGFGKYAVKYFSTVQDWEDYNWLNMYKHATFDVEVDSTLKSGYTFM